MRHHTVKMRTKKEPFFIGEPSLSHMGPQVKIFRHILPLFAQTCDKPLCC